MVMGNFRFSAERSETGRPLFFRNPRPIFDFRLAESRDALAAQMLLLPKAAVDAPAGAPYGSLIENRKSKIENST
jgi:hypothetical protein